MENEVLNTIVVGILSTCGGASVLWLFAQVIILGRKHSTMFANQNAFMARVDGYGGMIVDLKADIKHVNDRLDLFLKTEIDTLKMIAQKD